MSYRDHLARKGIMPIVIERTVKFGGDMVLKSSCLPIQHMPAEYKPRDRRGRFLGRPA